MQKKKVRVRNELPSQIKGQRDQGQQDREPLRGKSASERVSEREGFQRVFRGWFSEVFRDFQRF